MVGVHLPTSAETSSVYVTKTIYCTRTIISRGLYIFYPISKDHFFVFKEVFFQKILSLCIAYIQERLLIKSGLWWFAYGICYYIERDNKLIFICLCMWRPFAFVNRELLSWNIVCRARLAPPDVYTLYSNSYPAYTCVCVCIGGYQHQQAVVYVKL